MKLISIKEYFDNNSISVNKSRHYLYARVFDDVWNSVDRNVWCRVENTVLFQIKECIHMQVSNCVKD